MYIFKMRLHSANGFIGQKLNYPELEEKIDEIQIVLHNALHQRDRPKPVLGIGIGAAFQQHARHLHGGRRTVGCQAVVQRGIA
jgi:hypothetical protein